VLLDPAGTVLGTVLEVTIRGVSAPLAIPGSTLRAALISAQPQLKTLAELPKSPWPTRYLRVPGQPGTAANFASALADARKAIICPTCSGRGKIVTVFHAPGGGGGGGGGGRGGGGGGGHGGGGGGWGGGGPGDGPEVHSETCSTCGGEKYAMSPTVWGDLMRMIELGTRTAWAPTTDERTRLTYRKDVLAVLRGLVEVGRRFDRALNSAAAADLSRTGSTLPRGTLMRAEVKEHMDGPDGKYLLLAPVDSGMAVAVRLDDVVQLGGKANLGDHKDPADGSWVLLCGMALSRFDDGKRQGLFVLPLEWTAVAPPAAPGRAN